MLPLNDNDLDRLTREAADQYEVPAGISGWEALGNRLDQAMPHPEEKKRRRFLFWLLLIVLLAGGGVLYNLTSRYKMKAVEITDAGQMATPPAIPPTATPPSPIEKPAQRKPATDAIAKQTPKHTGPTAPEKTSRNQVTKPTKKTAPQDGFNTSASTARPDRPSATREAAAAGHFPPADTRPATGTTNDIASWPHALHPSRVGSREKWAAGAIQAPPLPIPPGDTNSTEQPEKKQQQNDRGFEIGLAAGPDMSNVKFTDADKMGYNVGLQLGYRFNDRWSIHTGLLYTRKNYTAQGKHFTKPSVSWWENRHPVGLQGYCAMWDIPLNVRYNVAVTKKGNWFVSAGASSYIMTKEDYNIDYTYGTGSTGGPIRSWYYDMDSTSTYLFSILNLSAGWEKQLNKRFSLQIEPYFKLPLKGLGYGKLDLNSYGIYLAAKYKFGKK